MKYVFSFLLILVFCLLLVPSNVVAIDDNSSEYYNNIDNVKLNKIDETDNYTIYNIDFFGGNRSKINGALFVPFNSNGNGIVVLNDFGSPIDTVSSDKFVRNGYTVIACSHRGSGKSEGYANTKYLPLDVMKQVTILENLDKINENLPAIKNIGVYGHCIAGDIAMETITLDPRIDAATISAFSGSLYESSVSVAFLLCSGKATKPFIAETFKGVNMGSSLMSIIKYFYYTIDSASHSAFKYAKQIEIPIMYIHGENDIEASVKLPEKAFNSTPSKEKELVIIPNANHWYVTSEGESLVDDVLNNAVDWFNKHL